MPGQARVGAGAMILFLRRTDHESVSTIVICAILLSLAGCVSIRHPIPIFLRYDEAERQSGLHVTWQDDKIRAEFQISDTEIDFRITNKTDTSTKLIWDEVSLVQFGKTQRVMHVGVKYVDRNSSQPASVIPPGSVLEDMVLPSDNVYTAKAPMAPTFQIQEDGNVAICSRPMI